MAINATSSGGHDRELIPAGNYAARCYAIIHLGTIEDTYKGVKKMFNKVRISWEIPELMRVFKEGEKPQPMAISKEYTLSTYKEARLRKMLDSWRGKGLTDKEAEAFDVSVLIGKCCMLNVIHTTTKTGDKQYEDIGSVSPMPKGLKCGPQINASLVWDYDTFDEVLLACLPEYVQNKIKSSEEYKSKKDPKYRSGGEVTAGPGGEDDDDLPF